VNTYIGHGIGPWYSRYRPLALNCTWSCDLTALRLRFDCDLKGLPVLDCNTPANWQQVLCAWTIHPEGKGAGVHTKGSLLASNAIKLNASNTCGTITRPGRSNTPEIWQQLLCACAVHPEGKGAGVHTKGSLLVSNAIKLNESNTCARPRHVLNIHTWSPWQKNVFSVCCSLFIYNFHWLLQVIIEFLSARFRYVYVAIWVFFLGRLRFGDLEVILYESCDTSRLLSAIWHCDLKLALKSQRIALRFEALLR